MKSKVTRRREGSNSARLNSKSDTDPKVRSTENSSTAKERTELHKYARRETSRAPTEVPPLPMRTHSNLGEVARQIMRKWRSTIRKHS